jgi:hypothetical protein
MSILRPAAEFKQFIDSPEARESLLQRRNAGVLTVVEDAADADVVAGFLAERMDELDGFRAAADEDGADAPGRLRPSIWTPRPAPPCAERPGRSARR